MLENEIKAVIRDVPDFPKEGIVFKDITPILAHPALCTKIVEELEKQVSHLKLDAIAGVEARGFLFGPLLAQKLGIPFVPIRKAGKLPYKTYQESYDLEYGQATIEMHQDAFSAGQRVLIHDDLLATGGTALAAAKLISKLAEVVGFSFLIDLTFLEGEKKLVQETKNIFSLVKY